MLSGRKCITPLLQFSQIWLISADTPPADKFNEGLANFSDANSGSFKKVRKLG